MCVGEEEAARFDEKFIQPLDESDNTGCDNDIAKIVGEFNPGWDTEQDYDGCFKKAVEFAKVILVNHFNAVAGILRATELVKADMEKCDGLFYGFYTKLLSTNSIFIFRSVQR